MRSATVLIWDIGGVLLSNGWDHEERARTAERFGLDQNDLNLRVLAHAPEYERGDTTLREFLNATVFYVPRPFSYEDLVRYVLGLSRGHDEVLDFARGLARRYGPMVALNNEGTEFNQYRIDTFGLKDIFRTFFSSCYTRLRKPEQRAFLEVTQVLQVEPSTCLFIDDRIENVEVAKRMGWNAIHFESPAQLAEAAHAYGFDPD